jgi:hypothetical protein
MQYTPLLTPVFAIYLVCSVLLLGMALFVFVRSPRAQPNRPFALTALALLLWVVTLVLYDRATNASAVLWLGRLNFAAIVLAVFFGYRFASTVAQPAPPRFARLLLGETVLLTLLSALTPLVDWAELPGPSTSIPHVTRYGPLFPLYLAHIVLFLAATLCLAFTQRQRLRHPARDQLLLIGVGVLATGAISLATNALLPYAFDDFRYIDIGPFSTVLFLLAVGYAIVRHRLFNVHVFLRKTLVYGLLLSLALAVYSSLVLLATDHVAAGSNLLTRFGVLVIAFSFDPLRRLFEKKIDALLFRHQTPERR